jgi:hypothetical protein
MSNRVKKIITFTAWMVITAMVSLSLSLLVSRITVAIIIVVLGLYSIAVFALVQLERQISK